MTNNTGLKYGIIAGVGASLYTLLFYLVDRPLMLSLMAFYSSFLIYIAVMVLAVRKDRTDQKGVIDRIEALRIAFTCFIVANAIFYIFYYAMYNFVDVDLMTIQKELSIDRFTEYYADRDDFQDNLERVKAADYSFGISTAFMGLARSIIGGFVLSYIIASFMKNEE